MGYKTITIENETYRFARILDDMSINIGNVVVRNGWQLLTVTPKLFDAHRGGHEFNRDLKRVYKI